MSAGGMGRLRDWARRVKRDVVALWLAAKDPRTPFAAKLVAAAVAAYALSPIDLIPDFIPVLGLLDDALIVPLGVLLAVRLVPPALMAEFRAEAERLGRRPVSRAGAVAVALLWALGVGLLAWVLWPAPAQSTKALRVSIPEEHIENVCVLLPGSTTPPASRRSCA